MPLYNVQVTLTMTMVVKAEDDDHARNVAGCAPTCRKWPSGGSQREKSTTKNED